MVAVLGRKFAARTLGMCLRQDLDEQIEFDGTNFVTKAGTSVTMTGYLVIPDTQDKVSSAICRFPSSRFRGHARVEYEYDANATSGDLPTAFVGTAFSDEGKSWRSDDVRLIDIRIVNDPIDSSAFCPKAFVNHDSANRPMHIIITNSQPMLVTSNGLEIITVARRNGSSALTVTIISALALSGIGYIAMALVKNRQNRK